MSTKKSRRTAKGKTSSGTRVSRADLGYLSPITLTIEGEEVSFPDYPAIAKRYCEGVVDREWAECRTVILACKRYLDMLEKAAKRKNGYWFSTEHAIDACDFMEKLPHVEGNWETRTLVLQPWQCFRYCAIFGFRRISDNGRLVEEVYEEIPRKSGKSLCVAGISLYCMVGESENGPLGYIAAATEDQAQKVLSPMRAMIEIEIDLVDQFKLKTSMKRIDIGFNRGEIRTIAAVGEHNDGHNPHVVVLEELHAQKPDVFEVMRSSFGSRRNPLLYQIGTAGRYASGIAWNQRQKSIRVLEGTIRADEIFVLIYAADHGDEENCYDEEVWKKVNPNWGISIFPDKVRNFARDAKAMPHQKGEFLRTRLNIWTNAGLRLIEPEAWRACTRKDLALRNFRGHRAWIGVDLAKYLDMAAVGIEVELDNDIIAGFVNFYIPAESPYLKRADLSGMYQSWIEDGFVNATPGGSINFATIEEDIRRLCNFLDVQMVGHDPWQAQQMAQALEEDGLPVTNYRNNASHMSDPTYELLARIQTGTFWHDGHPVLEWNAMNVEGEERNDTIFPRKPSENADEKIDGFVALVMANGLRLNGGTSEGPRDNPYETRSLNREAHG